MADAKPSLAHDPERLPVGEVAASADSAASPLSSLEQAPRLGAAPGAPSSAQKTEEASAARHLLRDWAPAPTLAQFIRHAELYGTEQVYETAQDFLAESELVQLALELNRVDGKPTGKRFSGKPKRRKRLSTEQKIQAAEFLRAEGAPNSRIATHLGIGERQVERLFQQARERRRAAREALQPDISAGDTPALDRSGLGREGVGAE